MARLLRFLPVALLALAACSTGSDDHDDAGDGGGGSGGGGGGGIDCSPTRVPAGAESGPHVLWSRDGRSLDNPVPDGRPITRDFWLPFVPPALLGPGTVELYRAYREQIDFSKVAPMAPWLLRFSAPPDPATLTAEHVFLVDGEGRRLAPPELRWIERDEGDPDTGFVFVRPTEGLQPGGRGVLVVTSGLRAADGTAFVRGAEAVADPECYPMEWSLAATAAGMPEDGIVFALPFEVLDPTTVLAEVVARMPTPEEPFRFGAADVSDTDEPTGVFVAGTADFEVLSPWLDSQTADDVVGGAPLNPDHAHVGMVGIGTFRSRDLRGAPAIENGSFRAPGPLKEALLADPASAPEVELDVVVTVPAGPAPEGGFPGVICQHGMGGENRVGPGYGSFTLGLAESLAQAGIACIGIDIVHHGGRGPFLPYLDPDGMQRTGFFDLHSLANTRDHFRQTTLDHLQLVRAIAAAGIDLDGDGTREVAAGDVGYFGVSLGGILGGTLVSIDPQLHHALLNVPGGGLANILASKDIENRIGLLLATASGGDINFGSPEYERSFFFFRAVAMQGMAEADPINYALLRPAGERPVLLQIGVGDLTVPEQTGLELAAALGVSQLTAPRTDPAGVSGYWVWDTAEAFPDVEVFNGHAIFWNVPEVREQARTWLSSGGTRL